MNARLEGAKFVKSHLEGANLSGAHLFMANLSGAYLSGTNFKMADLKGADLTGTDQLTIDLLSKVKTLHNAKLDKQLFMSLKAKYPALFEIPDKTIINLNY
jgi:uncharacterized protein YjbI with pentapeptide repeats